jgi:hypothetical protein
MPTIRLCVGLDPSLIRSAGGRPIGMGGPAMGIMPMTWTFVVRAGDGNRTRTTSLGWFRAAMGAELGVGVLARDRC